VAAGSPLNLPVTDLAGKRNSLAVHRMQVGEKQNKPNNP
jgi:hypothetical protein